MTGLEKLNIKWYPEDLDNALEAAGKAVTKNNRKKLEKEITNGFVDAIIENINERLEQLAENI